MKSWNRLLWGVAFRSRGSPPMMLGESWCEARRKLERQGVPSRALLFERRSDARAWCRKTNAEWRAANNAVVNTWRVRPVRVRETVTETQ